MQLGVIGSATQTYAWRKLRAVRSRKWTRDLMNIKQECLKITLQISIELDEKWNNMWVLPI
jgi:hypothetical protein